MTPFEQQQKAHAKQWEAMKGFVRGVKRALDNGRFTRGGGILMQLLVDVYGLAELDDDNQPHLIPLTDPPVADPTEAAIREVLERVREKLAGSPALGVVVTGMLNTEAHPLQVICQIIDAELKRLEASNE